MLNVPTEKFGKEASSPQMRKAIENFSEEVDLYSSPDLSPMRDPKIVAMLNSFDKDTQSNHLELLAQVKDDLGKGDAGKIHFKEVHEGGRIKADAQEIQHEGEGKAVGIFLDVDSDVVTNNLSPAARMALVLAALAVQSQIDEFESGNQTVVTRGQLKMSHGSNVIQ
jgi:hypothetical protein